MMRLAAWAIATLSLIVSSFWSLALHFPACNLCWTERGLFALIWLSLTFRRPKVVVPVALLGTGVAGFQWYLQWAHTVSVVCTQSTPCDVSPIHWGFVTTAGLATLSFLIIFVLCIVRVPDDWLRRGFFNG